MARIAALKRALAGVALVAALTACSAAPAASPAPVASPDAAPSAVAIPSPPASEPSAASTDSPAPSTPAKPRPSIDQADLEAFLTSSITLVNLADGDFAVTVAYLDTESDEAIDLGTYTLTSMEQQTNQVPPGLYRLEFSQPAGSATGPACTIELDDDDAYTFGAVEGAIAIAKAGEAPSDAADLIVPTSSLCLG